jgi:hypothetical protein
MLRALSLVACLVVLSGCSSNGSTTDETPTPTFTSVADTAVALAPALTDTMHLLDAPHMAGAAPTGSQVIRVPVRASGIPVTIDGADSRTWQMPRPATLTFLTGSTTLWVDVEGTVTNSNPTDPCFWRVKLYSLSTSSGGGNPAGVSMDPSFVCASEPAVVPVGVRALQLTFPGYDLGETAGDVLVLSIEADGGVLAPGASIDVLTGTPEYDSRVTVSGLQLPLMTQTLL